MESGVKLDLCLCLSLGLGLSLRLLLELLLLDRALERRARECRRLVRR